MLLATQRFQRLFTLTQFDAADFAADGLGQGADKLDLAWIFVGGRDPLDVLLVVKCLRPRRQNAMDQGMADTWARPSEQAVDASRHSQWLRLNPR